jgi:threonine aldolase
MSSLIVDLRSDTVTRPSPEMRQAIASAEVGDDVLGDDPTILRLQERVADLLGTEAALYVPSGTMANAVAIRAVCEHGDEIICSTTTHSYNYETAAPAALAGVSMRFVEDRRGIFTADAIPPCLRPRASHFPNSRMVIVENTNNRGGGAVWPLGHFPALRKTCDEHGLHLHIDGARLMNACIAAKVSPKAYTQHVDSVSMCFSKGLGAPVGSAIAGRKAFIERCHRFRKMFGGGMRQVGMLAAAALYAIEHNIERLAEDHANARWLAERLANTKNVTLNFAEVETNIIIFGVNPDRGSAADVAKQLTEAGVWCMAAGPAQIRFVTHLDAPRSAIEKAWPVIQRVLENR